MKFSKPIILVFILISFSCNLKVKVEYPSCYEEIQSDMMEKNYNQVLKLLESEKIPEKQMTDWYYYDYAAALYKMNPMNVRKALSFLKVAYQFNDKSYETNYYLGKFYFDFGDYKKALSFFTKCSKSKRNSEWSFDEKESWTFWIDVINYLYFNKFESTLMPSNDLIFHETLSATEISLENLFMKDDLSPEGKIFLCECYLKKNCNLMPSDFFVRAFYDGSFESSVITDYIDAKLLYKCIAENNDKILEDVLSKYNKNGLFLMNSSLPYVNGKFYKYLSFYYWKAGDGVRANNSLHIYKKYHLKLEKQTDKLEWDLANINKNFDKDEEFILLL